MNREEIVDLIRQGLDGRDVKYEIVQNEPQKMVIQIPTEQENFSAVSELEDHLADQGILFDTGYDIPARAREWCLDDSLEYRGRYVNRGRSRRSARVRRQTHYKVGDVLRIPLNESGVRGYGRILLAKPPMILVEFFPIVADVDPPIDGFRRVEWLLRLYTTDFGIVEDGTWQVIGHLPVAKIVKPLLWLEDPLTHKLLLFKDPLDQANPRETTPDEIDRLRAQPGMVHSEGSARTFVIDALRRGKLLR